jgi:CheY-like chemotaxis protein
VIRVMTVDDHPLLREGIATLIGNQTDIELVAEASNGREALEQFRKYLPDITLMDLQMRGWAEYPDARIVVLTTHPGDGQKRLPPELAAGVAEHATDSGLTPRSRSAKKPSKVISGASSPNLERTTGPMLSRLGPSAESSTSSLYRWWRKLQLAAERFSLGLLMIFFRIGNEPEGVAGKLVHRPDSSL